jgi:putative DNA-invertase from lambdoid prophage Rac
MRAAVWLRVSTDEQTTENQRAELVEVADRRGDEIVAEYDVTASAWKGNHVNAWSGLVRDARSGRFDRLYVWSLDRVSREGANAALTALNSLYSVGVDVVSAREPWLEQTGELRELLVAIFGWVAGYESRRRSERVLAGLARRKAAGLPLGRQPGARDLAPRKRAGYVERYDRQGRKPRSKKTTPPPAAVSDA